jgi:hypothetical protein
MGSKIERFAVPCTFLMLFLAKKIVEWGKVTFSKISVEPLGNFSSQKGMTKMSSIVKSAQDYSFVKTACVE